MFMRLFRREKSQKTGYAFEELAKSGILWCNILRNNPTLNWISICITTKVRCLNISSSTLSFVVPKMKLIFVVGECRKKMRHFFNISFQSPLCSVASFKRLQWTFFASLCGNTIAPPLSAGDKEGHRAQIDRLSVLMSASTRHCGKRWGITQRVRAMDFV